MERRVQEVRAIRETELHLAAEERRMAEASAAWGAAADGGEEEMGEEWEAGGEEEDAVADPIVETEFSIVSGVTPASDCYIFQFPFECILPAARLVSSWSWVCGVVMSPSAHTRLHKLPRALRISCVASVGSS